MIRGVNMKKHDIALWLLFFVIIAIRILFEIQYWIVLALEACALAIVLLFKAGKPSKPVPLPASWLPVYLDI